MKLISCGILFALYHSNNEILEKTNMRHNEKGLSLLEVMVSMIILSIGILGMAPLLVLSVDGNNTSNDMLTVSNLAKDRIEFFETLSPLPAMPFKETEANLGDGYNRYTVMYDNATDSTLSENICHLEVTISWINKSGNSRSTKYSTYIEKG